MVLSRVDPGKVVTLIDINGVEVYKIEAVQYGTCAGSKIYSFKPKQCRAGHDCREGFQVGHWLWNDTENYRHIKFF